MKGLIYLIVIFLYVFFLKTSLKNSTNKLIVYSISIDGNSICIFYVFIS